MATKSIVPRASGEGGLGRIDKPWGSIYARNIPYVDRHILNHQMNIEAHSNGIVGNAATCTKFQTPIKINNVEFDGSQNIEIPLFDKSQVFTESEIVHLFETIVLNR